MNKILLTLIFTSGLAGCASQPLLLKDEPTATFRVKYQKLVVENLAVMQKVSATDAIYVNGWVPIHDGFSPPLNDSFVSRMKKAIQPSGKSGKLEIAVLRVGLFMEKNVADDVVFIALLTHGRERGFKCDADISVKIGDESKRQMISYEIRRPYFDDTEALARFVESCSDELVKQVIAAIS